MNEEIITKSLQGESRLLRNHRDKNNKKDNINVKIDAGLISNEKVFTSELFKARFTKFDKITDYVFVSIEPELLKIFLMANNIMPSHDLYKITSLDDYYLLQLLLIEKEFKNNLNLNPNLNHILGNRTRNNFEISYHNNISDFCNSTKTISKSPIKNLNKNKLDYKQETIKKIPNDNTYQYETVKTPIKMNFENNNCKAENNNIAKQLSTSASNRKNLNIKVNTKQASSKSFVDSDNRLGKVDNFDYNISMNKLDIRNSIRNIDRLFEDNLSNFNIDDFNQLRISYSNQKNTMNSINSAIGDYSKSTIKKKEPITNEYFIINNYDK